eukprot:TRINITY_DN4310_c0_g1_i1.p1 TRINITY_DN4310_c0_g1~~TRINITY_DN4310_c0_g1_i1.p1  ORF type:complete len:162 (-),score=20.91 TRINITY_DN4310_c0_g1_i1:1068-1553(-)
MTGPTPTASLRKPGGSRRRSMHPGSSSKASKEKPGGSTSVGRTSRIIGESKAVDTVRTPRRKCSKEPPDADLAALQVDKSCGSDYLSQDAAKALGQPGLINNDSLLPSTSDKGSMSSAAEEETTHGCSGHSSDVTDRSDDPKKRRHEDTNTRAAPPEHTKT